LAGRFCILVRFASLQLYLLESLCAKYLQYEHLFHLYTVNNQNDKQRSCSDFGTLLTDGANDFNNAGGASADNKVRHLSSEGHGASRQKAEAHARTEGLPSYWQHFGILGTTQPYVFLLLTKKVYY
jgi:hypothetical protein